jgi:hypothetical protein
MKKRSVASVYLLTWITSAIYFFFWMFNIMRNLNVIMGNKVFDLKKKLVSILGILVPYTIIFCVLFINVKENNTIHPIFMIAFLTNFFLAILWFVLIVINLRQISESIAIVETNNRLEKPITKGKTTLFFFLYFIAIPYIQYHMNRIIDVYNQNNSRKIEQM